MALTRVLVKVGAVVGDGVVVIEVGVVVEEVDGELVLRGVVWTA